MADGEHVEQGVAADGEDALLDILRRIERANFPFRVATPALVAEIEALLRAGFVEGGIGRSAVDAGKIAVVRRISALGRARLALTRDSARGALE
ncbi:MAG: hypothetical protein QM777_14745 [Pseudorhodoferax sp.]